ncbi:MAG: hypothetical protein ACFCBU_06035 [Cyanophyceae cyanobacterium]
MTVRWSIVKAIGECIFNGERMCDGADGLVGGAIARSYTNSSK